jgi:hypothetical protein
MRGKGRQHQGSLPFFFSRWVKVPDKKLTANRQKLLKTAES